jgi:hypothetical protein
MFSGDLSGRLDNGAVQSHPGLVVDYDWAVDMMKAGSFWSMGCHVRGRLVVAHALPKQGTGGDAEEIEETGTCVFRKDF